MGPVSTRSCPSLIADDTLRLNRGVAAAQRSLVRMTGIKHQLWNLKSQEQSYPCIEHRS